ncbi:hypothetical protein HK103_003872 [Boothiomyces macroporosus]|uniref:Uncharacterized protein n=1 Tax=Boothiomyces macroporosus TaxID=261099 RepID=A0AAD5UNB8_9FUNG|nr:hypothetical protein HK103_003872 [Boothiomyces macroporosus]
MFINVLEDVVEKDEFMKYLLKLPKDDMVQLKIGELKGDYSTLVESNPVCNLDIFVSHIKTLDKKSMIEKLANRIEYEDSPTCWKILIAALIDGSYYGTEECKEIFTSRDWWVEYFTGMYFFIVFDLLGKDPQITVDEQEIDDLEIWELYNNEIY